VQPFFSLRKPALFLCLLLLATAVSAQPSLTLPQASPRASVSQTVGLTEMTITYHRPAVNARKIWGGLVPYGEVWRAGANENTTISFSSPVTVGGKTLAAGIYGLHILPTEGNWTVILSTVSSAWGSFSYDSKEDAARVTVQPQPADVQERLSYSFEGRGRSPRARPCGSSFRTRRRAPPASAGTSICAGWCGATPWTSGSGRGSRPIGSSSPPTRTSTSCRAVWE